MLLMAVALAASVQGQQVLTCLTQTPGDIKRASQYRVFENYIEPVLGVNEPKDLLDLKWIISHNDSNALVATRAMPVPGPNPNIFTFTLMLWKPTGQVVIVGNDFTGKGSVATPGTGNCRFDLPLAEGSR